MCKFDNKSGQIGSDSTIFTGYQNFAFNALVSDKIGFHRAVPDTRYPK